jgi:hypothetical protein
VSERNVEPLRDSLRDDPRGLLAGERAADVGSFEPVGRDGQTVAELTQRIAPLGAVDRRLQAEARRCAEDQGDEPAADRFRGRRAVE